MSKFYVGQRVRVRASTDPDTDKYVGMEGVVVEVNEGGWIDGATMYGLDILPITLVDEAEGIYLGWRDEELEPLVPPHEACDNEFKASLDELLARREVPA